MFLILLSKAFLLLHTLLTKLIFTLLGKQNKLILFDNDIL